LNFSIAFDFGGNYALEISGNCDRQAVIDVIDQQNVHRVIDVIDQPIKLPQAALQGHHRR